MFVYGFATWGAYICGVQDVKEDIDIYKELSIEDLRSEYQKTKLENQDFDAMLADKEILSKLSADQISDCIIFNFKLRNKMTIIKN